MTKLNHVSALSLSLALLGAFSLGACDSGGDEESASEASTGESSDSDSTSGGSDSSTSGGTNNSSGSSEGSDSSSSEATTGGTTDSTTDPTDTDATTGGTSGMTTVGTSESGSDSDTDTDSTTGEPPQACGDAAPIEGLVTSMAYLKSQIPPDMTSGSGSSGSSGGEEQDPSTLYIRLSDQDFTCKDPSGILECGPQWSATIVIPPEYQAPGVYAFGLGEIIGVFTETGEDEGGNECSFGGGSWEGTIEIVSIDETQVEARLCDVQDPWFETKPNLNGTLYAERCQ